MHTNERRTILFICHHGAAKSVLAAADLGILAAERGVPIVVAAAGVEPSEQVSPAVVQALAEDGVDIGQSMPRRVTQDMLASAWRVVTFNLHATDLQGVAQDTERWDDVPAVSEDLQGARAAIGRHLVRLVDSFDRKAGR